MKPKHPTIPMCACKSSLIESIGHDGKAKNRAKHRRACRGSA